jgi:hypothetical protein
LEETQNINLTNISLKSEVDSILTKNKNENENERIENQLSHRNQDADIFVSAKKEKEATEDKDIY